MVLAVGARLREQASSLTLTSRAISLALGERGFQVAGQSDEWDFEAFERFEETDDFFGFAAVGDGDQSVAASEHAEVAVESFAGMKKERWRAGAGECGGDFSRDEAGLAHAGEDDAAFAGEEEIDGFFEGGVEACKNVLDGLGFDFEDAAGGVEAHEGVIRDLCVVFRERRRGGLWQDATVEILRPPVGRLRMTSSS